MKLIDNLHRLIKVQIILFDFDGVFTDNCVYVTTRGEESVRCWRGDGIGLHKIKSLNIPTYVISTEKDGVVSKRAEKLGITCYQDVRDKLVLVKSILESNGISHDQAIFVGNDENDLNALEYVGFPILPRDANPSLLNNPAFIRCERDGGRGVVREICEAVYWSKMVKHGEL